MRALIALAFALAGCASAQPVPREGAPIDINTPQAADQCAAQRLDWCDAARR